MGWRKIRQGMWCESMGGVEKVELRQGRGGSFGVK